MNWSAAKLGADSFPATQSDDLSQNPFNCVLKGRLILLGHMGTKILRNDSNTKDQIRTLLMISKIDFVVISVSNGKAAYTDPFRILCDIVIRRSWENIVKPFNF